MPRQKNTYIVVLDINSKIEILEHLLRKLSINFSIDLQIVFLLLSEFKFKTQNRCRLNLKEIILSFIVFKLKIA